MFTTSRYLNSNIMCELIKRKSFLCTLIKLRYLSENFSDALCATCRHACTFPPSYESDDRKAKSVIPNERNGRTEQFPRLNAPRPWWEWSMSTNMRFFLSTCRYRENGWWGDDYEGQARESGRQSHDEMLAIWKERDSWEIMGNPLVFCSHDIF